MNGPNGVMENAANHAEEECVLSTGKSNQMAVALLVTEITTLMSLATKILVLVIFSKNKENIFSN